MKSIRSVSTITLDLLKGCVLELKVARWLPKRKSHLGRPPTNSLSLFLATLLKIRENWPYDTTIVNKLKENSTFREFCGFKKNSIPSHNTFSRFNKKLTDKKLQFIIRKIDEHLVKSGAFLRDELAIDATDLLSNGRNRHNLDPDAGFGYKTDKERFHGYWAVFITGTKSEMIRSVRITPANIHQSMTCQELLKDIKNRNTCSATLFLADGAYDDKKTYSKCIELGLVPLIAYNPKRAKIKDFMKLKKSNWRKRSIGDEGVVLYSKHYNNRLSVERYQSTFKEILNGRVLPVRGFKKVNKYLLLTSILSQLYGFINLSLKNSFSSRRPISLDYFLS